MAVKKGKKKHSLRVQMLAMNLGITLTSLLLCGLIFVFSVWLIMQRYIEHDIDFFLTQTADNLNAAVGYLEGAVSDLRKSNEIMDYLEKADRGHYTEKDKEEFQIKFEKILDISTQKNNVDGKFPLVEKIYLFSNDGRYYSSFYYAMVYSQVEQSDKRFQALYEESRQGRQPEYEYIKMEDKNLYLIFPLFDEKMEQVATIIYEIRIEALRYLMKNVEGYEKAFWTIYDEQGKVMTDYGGGLYLENLDKLQNTWEYGVYREDVQSRDYRIYSKDICMNMRVTIGIPENQTVVLMLDSVKLYTALIIVTTLLVTTLFIVVIYRLTKPLQEVTVQLKRVQEGEFSTKLPDYNNEEFHKISLVFNEMTEYINHLIKQVYEKQISIKEMEIKFLQAQMNPHFMFNVLNTIGLQARLDGNEEVYKMIRSFSQLIQAKIYRVNTEKVMIRQELEYVDYYLYLQSFRYGERLSYEIEIEEEEILDLYIPKLCLQLIVENAVVHGIEPMIEKGKVQIRIYVKKDTVYIDTIDNGMGFADGEVQLPMQMSSSDQGHNHVGLNNAHHLLKLMYGEGYGLYVYSRIGEGTVVSIRFPKPAKTEVGKTRKSEGNICSE